MVFYNGIQYKVIPGIWYDEILVLTHPRRINFIRFNAGCYVTFVSGVCKTFLLFVNDV